MGLVGYRIRLRKLFSVGKKFWEELESGRLELPSKNRSLKLNATRDSCPN